MLDLILASIHHLLAFGLFGILCAELAGLRPGMSRETVARLSIIDLHYGMFAGLIVIVGFTRAILAAKGWDYYASNHFFWAKVATFVLIGMLSLKPTRTLIQWRRQKISPDEAQIRAIRPYLWVELGLFALLPIFAACMARGYGQVPA